MKTIYEWMTLIRALLMDPNKWTQKAIARNRTGTCSPTDKSACRFCLYGAICHIIRGGTNESSMLRLEVAEVIRKAIEELFPEMEMITKFNDSPLTTHDHVVSVLNRAVELAAVPAA